MNILHIVYAKMWGGAEQYVYNFCKEEKRRGHFHLVVADIKQPNAASRFQEVALTKVIGLHGIKKFFSLRVFLRLIDEHHINIVNCHSGTMTPLCMVLKCLRPHIKLVIYRHNASPNHSDWYHRYVQHKADAFICVSRLVYDSQCQTADAQNKHKFHLVYNGIDTARLENLPHTPHRPLKIGYAGRIVESKGILVLLQALRMLLSQYNLPCELYLVGQEDPAFKSKSGDFIAANQLEPYCHIRPFTQDIAAFYRGIDIFVLPSLVKESFGLVLCEAMYSGLPVVSTNNGAQKEIVEDGKSGLLVPPNDAAALAKQIALLATDTNTYLRLAQVGPQRVKENFTLELTVDKMNELYHALEK